MKNSTPHALRHLRQERQRARPLRRRPRRPRPRPSGQARHPRRPQQVLDPERAHRRPAHQPRARPIPRHHPRHGPRARARQRPRDRPRPRPAAHGEVRPHLRRGAGDRHRDPRGELEGPQGLRVPVALQHAQLRPAASCAQARRRGHHRRRHGRALAHLVEQARDRPAASPAHRRGHEVGHRAGAAHGQPRRRGDLRRAAEEHCGAQAPAGPAARRGRGRVAAAAALRHVPESAPRVRVPGAHRRSLGRGAQRPLGRDRPGRGGVDRARRAHEGGPRASGAALAPGARSPRRRLRAGRRRRLGVPVADRARVDPAHRARGTE